MFNKKNKKKIIQISKIQNNFKDNYFKNFKNKKLYQKTITIRLRINNIAKHIK